MDHRGDINKIKVKMSSFHGSVEPELPPLTIHPLREVEAPSSPEPFYSNYHTGIPIAIDVGTSSFKIGLTNETNPNNVFPSLVSRYRERKYNKMLTLVGNDVFREQSARTNSKSPFDGPLVNNWDYIEYMLDYSFSHLNVNSQNGVNNPIVMTEVVGSHHLYRKNMSELLFEAYNVPKMTFGVDSLFSYYANGGTNGLVIGTGHNTTHVVPVVQGKGILTQAKRINWGGEQASNYLTSLMALKYPYFPGKISSSNASNLIKDFCYVSTDFQKELTSMFDMDVLESKNIVSEAPFNEVVQVQKSEEELARQAEKRKEGGRRLQEQAQKMRLEKLLQKEQDLEYFIQLQKTVDSSNKKIQQQLLQGEGFTSVNDLTKQIAGLEKAIKKARHEDIGEDEIEEPSFPLIDIPDDQLSETDIKEKRKQRLMKANYDARMRAKDEKEAEKKRLEEQEKKEQDSRDSNLQGWIHQKRTQLEKLMEKRKERKKLKADLGNRKSQAAQQRMKNIASLATEDTSKKRKRNNATIDNDPEDTFGADDGDWAIYRDITNVDIEEEEQVEQEDIYKIEQELLKYDDNFSIEDTLDSQYDWRRSVLHKFLRGPRPFNSENSHEQHQIHLNIERIRIPEVLFQPSIAGVDQAGIVEISEDMLLRRLQGKGFSGDSYDVLQDIFVTGGQAYFQNFEERIHKEFSSFLPVGAPLKVRRAKDPITDAWRGMAKFARSAESKNSYITKKDYEEMGSEYIKEHNFGNPPLI